MADAKTVIGDAYKTLGKEAAKDLASDGTFDAIATLVENSVWFLRESAENEDLASKVEGKNYIAFSDPTGTQGLSRPANAASLT